MAGIIHKIEEKFKGGKKEGEKRDEHKSEYGYGQHKPEQKEGFLDKIKGKVHGQGGKEKKKKKERKSKGDGHHHDHSSSSSDSD